MSNADTLTNKPETNIQWSRIATAVLGALVVMLAIWQFFSAIDDRDFHRDEARWIHRAVYLREALHPFSDYWQESTWYHSGTSIDEVYRLRAQPPVGSYVIGIGMLLPRGSGGFLAKPSPPSLYPTNT